MPLLINFFFSGIPVLLCICFHKLDGLAVRRKGLVCISGFLLASAWMTGINEQFILSVLLFHVYTDEGTMYVYSAPTVFAAAVELVRILAGPVTAGELAFLAAGCVLTGCLSRVGAFASGDAAYIYVILMSFFGKENPFIAACGLIFLSSIAFLIRMALVNAVLWLKERRVVQRAPFMASIFAGYLCLILSAKSV